MEIQKAQREVLIIIKAAVEMHRHFTELTALTMFTDHNTTDLTKKGLMSAADVVARNASGSCHEMIGEVHKLDLMLDELARRYGPDSTPPIPAGWKRISEERPELGTWFTFWGPNFAKPETRLCDQTVTAYNWNSYPDHIWSPIPELPPKTPLHENAVH